MGYYGYFLENFKKKYPDRVNIVTEVCIGFNQDMCAYTYKQETRKLEGDPENAYIEIYNSNNKRKATKMVRLLIGEPYYRDHKDQQPLWKMNAKEIKELNDFLNSDSNVEKYKGKTVFQAALDFYNIDPNLPVTDYTNMKLEPSSSQKKKDKDSKKKK